MSSWKPRWKPGKEPYHVVRLSSWAEYREWVDERLENWIFRGQADQSWPLWSSLSRRLRALSISPRLWPEQEARILRVFKRKAHLFLKHVPQDLDDFQWLAIMQHHGSPTRLLDMTWSPYTAAFFAFENAMSDVAVWAIHFETVQKGATVDVQVTDESGHPVVFKDRSGESRPGPTPQDLCPKWFPRNDREWLRRTHFNFYRYFVNGEVPFVFLGEPHVMNQRLIAQNATFAMPSMLDRPVDEILGSRPEWAKSLVKLVLPIELRRAAIKNLYSMNVTNASLFPGLDGLARSMGQELEYHWKFNPYTGEVLKRLDDPRAGWDST